MLCAQDGLLSLQNVPHSIATHIMPVRFELYERDSRGQFQAAIMGGTEYISTKLKRGYAHRFCFQKTLLFSLRHCNLGHRSHGARIFHAILTLIDVQGTFEL